MELPETMEEVLPETSRLDSGIEILVGCGYDTHIHFDLSVAPQAVKGISIEHSQKLNLGLELQVANFIQE